MRVRIAIVSCALLGCDPPAGPTFQCTESEGVDLYEKRIAPLLADDRPKSCNACHLSGVDLELFVRDTPCATMACMIDRELVDLQAPEDSLVIAWIERATPSGGITQATIDEERAAVLQWIERTAACGQDECAPIEDPCGAPDPAEVCPVPEYSETQRPLDDPGDCSDRTLELVFREKVYSWRGRCALCHAENDEGKFDDAPKWIVTGPCDPASLATLRNAQERGMLDADDAMASTLVLEPLDERLGGIEHGGAAKFHDLQDPAYLDFVYFLERWADCK